jgi:hypothetical protein
MPYQKSIELLTGDYTRALGIAERFNINSGARPYRRVRASLTQAIDFAFSLVDEIKKGNTINVGSPHHDDTFLDKAQALKIARQKERTAYLTGTVAVDISQRDLSRLASIRKTFNLGSDRQAATLAVRLYQSACDNLWRGNNFSVEESGGTYRSLDTDNLREKLTFNY